VEPVASGSHDVEIKSSSELEAINIIPKKESPRQNGMGIHQFISPFFSKIMRSVSPICPLLSMQRT
jgi:hypothetical protein